MNFVEYTLNQKYWVASKNPLTLVKKGCGITLLSLTMPQKVKIFM